MELILSAVDLSLYSYYIFFTISVFFGGISSSKKPYLPRPLRIRVFLSLFVVLYLSLSLALLVEFVVPHIYAHMSKRYTI